MVKFTEPEVERFVEQQVRSGAFPSAEALFEEAVRRMMVAGDFVEVLSAEESDALAEAREEIERGEGIELRDFVAAARVKYGLARLPSEKSA